MDIFTLRIFTIHFMNSVLLDPLLIFMESDTKLCDWEEGVNGS